MFQKINFSENDSGSLIDAKNDSEAIALFYRQKKASTRASFEREIRRFMNWLDTQGLTLKDVAHKHVTVYKEILENPPEEACGPPVKYYLDAEKKQVNPDWKPFVGKLSPSSIKTALNLLSSFGRWLTEARYLDANPFSLINKSSKSEGTIENQSVKSLVNIEHHFTPIEMLWINKAFEEMISNSTDAKEEKALVRGKFIFAFMRRTGLRREEMVRVLNTNLKKAFLGRSGKTIYVLHGIGKGDKEFKIPLHFEVREALQEYRQSLALSPLPASNDNTTILKTKRGQDNCSPNSLYRDLKYIFSRLADHIHEIGQHQWKVDEDTSCDFIQLVSNLREATPHWIRHSAITENAAIQDDVKKLQEFARHASIDTTSIYWNVSIEEMNEAIERL